MKILLDENLPLNLKRSFGNNHEVFSVRDLRWSGVKNGELLKLMAAEGFNAFLTMDQNLPNQQNLTELTLTIFLLRGVNNKFETLSDLIPFVLKEIELGINLASFKLKNNYHQACYLTLATISQT